MIKARSFALAAIIAMPGFAFAQSTTTPGSAGPGSGGMTSPSTRPSTMSPVAGPSTPAPATYTTADQMTRASKVIGATVYNDQNETVGSINELLIDAKHDISGVVLSVGGFLGINSKLVKVAPADIRVTGDKLVMSGASKDSLKQMPDYKMVPANAS